MREIADYRQTGKTTRLIERICALQDEGADVIVLVPDSRYILWWLDMALNLPRGDGIDPSRCTMMLASDLLDGKTQGLRRVFVAEDVDRWTEREREMLAYVNLDTYTYNL